MDRRIIAFFPVLLGGGLACRTGAAPPPSPAAVREGVFDYWAEAQRYELRGVVRLTADTVVLEPQVGSCRPAIAPTDRLFAHFDCDGPPELARLELRFDRRNPQLASRWQATSKVQKQRQTCAKEAAADDGQRICMRYESQEYEELVTQSGPLRVRLRSGASPE